MTDNHPITPPIIPPPELVREWAKNRGYSCPDELWDYIAIQAARWGADRELEACCEWVSQWRCMVGGNRPEVGLRSARRPKPPSLKEQALAVLDDASNQLDAAHENVIRRALESL